MQALKDAGIVLALITFLLSVRVTRIEPAETEAGLLAAQTEAAAAPVLPAKIVEGRDRCSEILLRIETGADEDFSHVFVLEAETGDQAVDCSRT